MDDFEYISESVRPKLLAVVRKYLRVADASEDAEDIVQEALVALWGFVSRGMEARNGGGRGVQPRNCKAPERVLRRRRPAIHAENEIQVRKVWNRIYSS